MPALRVRVLHEAGAVEAGLRRLAAPLVRRAEVLLRLVERGQRLRSRRAAVPARRKLRRGVGRRPAVTPAARPPP